MPERGAGSRHGTPGERGGSVWRALGGLDGAEREGTRARVPPGGLFVARRRISGADGWRSGATSSDTGSGVTGGAGGGDSSFASDIGRFARRVAVTRNGRKSP